MSAAAAVPARHQFGKPAIYRLDDAVQMLHVIIDMHVIAPLSKLLDHARQEHVAERAGRQNAQMASLRLPKIAKAAAADLLPWFAMVDILIERLPSAVGNSQFHAVEIAKAKIVLEVLDGV